ncbi:hypothetical protein QBC43DRAFT_317256 [Cladorrhinum sp. PSN259]|nr:hypothetical protein QBC43DRAFT_317256 [Cladorrhinum sp. PSN259]
MANSHLLNLPREIRNQIYEDYLTGGDDGGYIFNFASATFKDRSTQAAIDLNLMYTCRQIAAEMHSLPFRFNTLYFSTAYDDELRLAAGRFQNLLLRMSEDQREILYMIVVEINRQRSQPRPVCSPKVLEKARTPPLCSVWPLWDLDGQHRDIDGTGVMRDVCPCLGQIPSVYREAQKNATLLFSNDETITHETCRALKELYCWADNPNLSALLQFQDRPWAIPTKSELSQLEINQVTRMMALEKIPIPHADDGSASPTEHGSIWRRARAKLRFSAASVAIRFLNSLSPEKRLWIRNVVVLEDASSVPYPECHALGLIPFCQENPKLRIDRRVNLWRNILLDAKDWFRGGIFRSWRDDLPAVVEERAGWWAPMGENGEIMADQITALIAEWLSEASVLCDAGMPRGVFTLTIDGDPAPEQSSEIFAKYVHRDAAWQIVAEEHFMAADTANHLQPHDFINVWNGERIRAYQCKNFPQVLADMVDGTSTYGVRVRSNFDPGPMWTRTELNGMIQEVKRDGLTAEDWAQQWSSSRWTGGYWTRSPLPKFRDLLFEDVIRD